MGSPSSRLKTAEQYRPWVDAGLEYVFAPDRAGQVVHENPVRQGLPQAQQPPQRPAQQPTPQPVQQQRVQQQSIAGAQPVAQQAQPPIQPAANVHFPDPWAGFLSKVKATAPKVVCTYMELGLDLGGQPDPKRGSVLRNTLTNHLKWPPGTAAFWPVAALTNGTLQPNANMFWKGWDLWKSPYIACFGEEALRVIHPQAEPGSTTYLLEHVTIFVVPPLAQLVTMLPHEQQISTELLASVRI